MLSRRVVQSRPLRQSQQFRRNLIQLPSLRTASSSSSSSSHGNFYRSHGRALFKCLTLAFFSYQVFYWSWITLESETTRDEKNREIKELEEEVKLLGSGRGSHLVKNNQEKDGMKGATRLLEEKDGI